MKYYIFKSKDGQTKFKTKKLNIRRIIKISICIVIIALIATIVLTYRFNANFREFFDVHILRKEISNENTVKVELSSEGNDKIYAYNKYVTVLSKNSLKVYTNTSNPVFELEVAVANPIYDSHSRFLCIAEKSGNKVYLISAENIIWQKDVEGEITKVNVNKNGYVAVSTTNAGYKTIITLYNSEGEELFKTYLPTTYSIDMEISNDNKYLAIGEVTTSGTTLQTDVRIISVENAKSNPKDAFVKTYEPNSKHIITNLKYQEKNLICMYDDRIVSMNDTVTKLTNIDNNTLFADIETNNNIVKVVKQVGGILKTNYYLQIINTNTKKEVSYELSTLPKAIYATEDVIAINYGTEIEFINTYGWLIKRYKSLQEINDLVLTNSLAGIILSKDKMEIINF